MRVAMVGPFGLRPKGTMAVRALPLARALHRRGHDVTLLLPPWSYPEDEGKIWNDEGVRIENTAISPRPQIPLRLLEGVRRLRPDIVHLFKPKAYAGLTQWLVWYLRGAGLARGRVVLDMDDWEGQGGWNDIGKYSWLEKRFFSWQEEWGLEHNDAVTVASRELETILWSRGRPLTSVHYLPNGFVPFGEVTEQGRAHVRGELGIGSAPLVLLYTRFFEYHVERLVAILVRLAQRVPLTQVLVVGKGLYGEQFQFAELMRRNGLGDRLYDVGWVDPARLPDYFAAADLALYPFDDTLVNRCKCAVKLVDLLAAGVPVLAEAVGQNKEYIVHNENGVLVPAGGVIEMARAAAELLCDPLRRQQLGMRAAARMHTEFTWDHLAAEAERAYLG